jgi:hypothetical protein
VDLAGTPQCVPRTAVGRILGRPDPLRMEAAFE